MKKNLIERLELTGLTSYVTFTSLPQTYDGLYIVASMRSSDTVSTFEGGYDPWLFRYNGSDTGYTNRELYGTGAAVGTTTDPNRSGNTWVSGTWARCGNYGVSNANNTSNVFSTGSMLIPNYAGSNYKSTSAEMVKENNTTNAHQHMNALLWSNTAAITSISFALGLGQFVAGTSFSIYGITAGSDGTTTVS